LSAGADVRYDCTMARRQRPQGLRSSGYVGRLQQVGYGIASPLYDLCVSLAMLPMGGQRKWRHDVANWLEASDGQRVLSLCCGTGTTDRALLEAVPGVQITGIDLGRAQIRRARSLDRTGRIAYRIANAAATGLSSQSFERVLLVGALHEMPRPLRRQVLAEARRVIAENGR
jgi:demethylmenaquinone methyltransferase/2-methoxy-6-polyprenyl-1,4-benzoquinol methylase